MADIIRKSVGARHTRWRAIAAAVGIVMFGTVGAVIWYTRPVSRVTLNRARQPGKAQPAGVTATSSASAASSESLVTVTSAPLGVSMQVPAIWKLNASYAPATRYDGTDGFIELGQSGVGPSEECTLSADHVLRPYGNQPTIVSMTVAGQPACFVTPSADAPLVEGFAVATLAVAYPHPTSSIKCLIVDTDVNHAAAIAASLKFGADGSP